MAGDAIRGTRIGAGGSKEDSERGDTAPRRQVDYWCANGHHIRPSFAADADVPEQWDCPRCGLPAGQNKDHPPSARRSEPYKSHFAYVKERRTDADGMALLDEALARLKERRDR